MSVFNVVNALRSTEKDSCPSLRSWIRWQTSSAWQRNRKLGFPFCFTVMPIVHCFLGHTRCWSETQLPRTDVWLWVTVSDLVLNTMQLFSCVLQQGLYKSFALASDYTISLGYKSFEHFDTDKNPSERMPQMARLYCCVVSCCVYRVTQIFEAEASSKGKNLNSEREILTDWVRNWEFYWKRKWKRGGQYSIFLYFMYTSPAGTYVSKPLPTSDKRAQVLRYWNGYMESYMVFSASDILVWPAIHNFRQCLPQANRLVTE